MLRRYYVILLTFFLVSLTARGQYDASFSHYWAMETSFNPAAVGKQSKINVTAAYAIDMAALDTNPQTMYAPADMPF